MRTEFTGSPNEREHHNSRVSYSIIYLFIFYIFPWYCERGSETLTQPRQPQRCNVVTANAYVGQTSRVIKISRSFQTHCRMCFVFGAFYCWPGCLSRAETCPVLHWGLVSSRLHRLPARIWAACLHGCHDASAFTSTERHRCSFAPLISSVGELGSALI